VWSLLADILGLIGSIVLAFPAIRCSSYLKQIESIKRLVSSNNASVSEKEVGKNLVRIMGSHSSRWNKWDHRLLLLGLILLIAAFAIKVLYQI